MIKELYWEEGYWGTLPRVEVEALQKKQRKMLAEWFLLKIKVASDYYHRGIKPQDSYCLIEDIH